VEGDFTPVYSACQELPTRYCVVIVSKLTSLVLFENTGFSAGGAPKSGEMGTKSVKKICAKEIKGWLAATDSTVGVRSGAVNYLK
jgi:hypothetical protein